jgi:DNA polymerase III gamma/tau subunit
LVNCATSWQREDKADEDALALLAEAGDGSMRDALSILDQAIASTSDHLTADSVRSLIGSAPAAALETVMQAVAESSSEKILVLVDELIGEGHSPTHFARQLVRFLRNVTVAKIAGKDSALLQISSDERARVARIAELFTEEDLARHLQIMLRTHGELGYRQEQRFHLELGLLKMAHAQRLLPIEQLLSEVALPLRPVGPGIVNRAPGSSGFVLATEAARAPHRRDQTRCRRSQLTRRAKVSQGGAAGEFAGFAGGGARATQAATSSSWDRPRRRLKSRRHSIRSPSPQQGRRSTSQRRVSARCRSQRAGQSANAGLDCWKARSGH